MSVLYSGILPAQTPTTIYSYSITDSNGNSGYDTNGNVLTYIDSVTGIWSLGYDSLNRLTSSSQQPVNGPLSYGCWNYDSFGNPTVHSTSDQPFAASTTSSPCQSTSSNYFLSAPAFADGTNRITGGSWSANNGIISTGAPSYDASGNITSDQQSTYVYDEDNRICATQSSVGTLIGYLYDAEGHRVAKGTLTTLSCDQTSNGFQLTAAYVIGPNGEEITEVDGSGAMVHTNVSAADRLIATYQPEGLHFQLTDWLGTKRAQTNVAGAIEEVCSSQPFGDSLSCQTGSGETEASQRHFTGKERDAESGLDYFGARYYASNTARFMSPDWASGAEAIPYAQISNPQSLNLYAYTANNPLKRGDADGHLWKELLNYLIYDVYTRDTGYAKHVFYNRFAIAQARAQQAAGAHQPQYRVSIGIVFPVGGLGIAAELGVGADAVEAVDAANAAEGAGSAETAEAAEGTGTTQHGAERIAERNFSEAEINQAKTGTQYTQDDGATAYVKKLANGRYNVVVEGDGGDIVTVMKNKTASEIRGLAQNYGWR